MNILAVDEPEAASVSGCSGTGQVANSMTSVSPAELRPLIECQEDRDSLIKAVTTLSPLSLDLKLRVNGRQASLEFNLTFD